MSTTGWFRLAAFLVVFSITTQIRAEEADSDFDDSAVEESLPPDVDMNALEIDDSTLDTASGPSASLPEEPAMDDSEPTVAADPGLTPASENSEFPEPRPLEELTEAAPAAPTSEPEMLNSDDVDATALMNGTPEPELKIEPTTTNASTEEPEMGGVSDVLLKTYSTKKPKKLKKKSKVVAKHKAKKAKSKKSKAVAKKAKAKKSKAVAKAKKSKKAKNRSVASTKSKKVKKGKKVAKAGKAKKKAKKKSDRDVASIEKVK
ncbi:MAG: hypothetical protein AB7F86_05950 [Bdellovibrionales bacterium]